LGDGLYESDFRDETDEEELFMFQNIIALSAVKNY